MALNVQRAVFVVGVIFAVASINKAEASTFTIVNSCDYAVWPGIQAGAGTSELSTTGFALSPSESTTIDVPAGWSGRLWGRTFCTFDAQGKGTCVTGDCGGSLLCNGNNAAPPATLAEFTLGQATSPDFYDVSLVDGYNLPIMLSARGGSGTCSNTGCATDLNLNCPKELQIDTDAIQSVACKSACEAFGNPEYCCSGAFGNPNTCKPSSYSQVFKTACPKAYSYAYDDVTSTFTCTSASYVITFCPTVTSQKRSGDSSSDSMANDNDTWSVSTAASTSEAAPTWDGSRLRAVTVGLFSVAVMMVFVYDVLLSRLSV